MPHLRAPYYRRSQTRVDTIVLPGESASIAIPNPSVDHVYGVATVGALVVYYDDKTPEDLDLTADQEVDPGVTDGIIGVQWTDNTDDLYHHRVLRQSGNTWYVAGQVSPGTSKYSVSGFTQLFVNVTIGVQSLSTIDTFTSQITYDTIFIGGGIP